MYPNISLDDINYSSPKAIQELHEYYHVQIDSLSFVLDQACELIESETPRNIDSNVAIALKMLESAGKRMEGLMMQETVQIH